MAAVRNDDFVLAKTELASVSRFKTEGEVVEPLGRAVEHRGDSGLGTVRHGGASEALTLCRAGSGRRDQFDGINGEVFGDLVLTSVISSAAAEGVVRAEVGGEVGDGEVVSWPMAETRAGASGDGAGDAARS